MVTWLGISRILVLSVKHWKHSRAFANYPSQMPLSLQHVLSYLSCLTQPCYSLTSKVAYLGTLFKS